MSQKFLLFILLSSSIFMSACGSEKSAPETQQEPAAVEKEAPKRPTFADAMEVNKPLAKVKGDYRALGFDNLKQDGLFNEALDYVASTESYSLLIWHDGQLRVEHYFDGYDAELRADTASMHKSVTALLIGTAIEDGFIESVDDPIGLYIPQWKNDSRGQIPLRRVLEMSSGLKPLSSEGGMSSPAVKFIMQGETVRETMLGQPLAETPGDVFYYQNSSTQLLGLVLENATGQDYGDYLSTRLWQPLGAKDAYVWLNEPTGFPKTFTSYLATSQDWLRLGLLLKDKGIFEGQQIVSQSYVEAMISPSKANPNYGWQIWLGTEFEPKRFYNDEKIGYAVAASEAFLTDDIIYLDGFGGQRVYISRSQDLVIVRTGNASMSWDDAKLPNAVIKALQNEF